ncbi:hypothetical protein SAMN02746041_00130 [Desulfacinum hydrothermale DSM 13146]|uniref:Uncharacterized protein n=1 Tax=Desulfacinum hydrothermale DSM 13146 TaxID=1121390 RepID=A0A1W1WY43_9BACT|nr:hypothetical protein [Desulfacinum hydrothermale]SMC16649.1 hypothetical protein SAMN02746041_00130 [Desulfacinum hydrothermale DSM 13146]
MFTKLLLVRVVLPLAILLVGLKLLRHPWLVRLKEKIRFDIWVKRILLVLLVLAGLAYGADKLIDWIGPDKEELTIQRQGGRESSLPPPIHGRPFGRP